MHSRLIFRSIQSSTSSLILNRFLSLTKLRSVAATKLSETSNSNDISSSSSNTSETIKTYSNAVHQIADEISKLSLVEVMDLNDLLKKKEEEDEEENLRPNAQSTFKIRLIKFDETKKVSVIKQVKDVVENINLIQAKKLVESVPQVLRDNLSESDAETMKAKIEAAGGICAIE